MDNYDIKDKEILERIFETTHLCIAYLDRDFNFVRVNKAYAKGSDKSPGYFTGKNHFDLYPDKENEAIFRKVVETGESFTIRAKPFEFDDHPDWGVTFWDWTLAPLKNDQGKVEALLLMLLEVTEYIRSESDLRSRIDELERYSKVTSSREIRMHELVKENERLKERIGELTEDSERER